MMEKTHHSANTKNGSVNERPLFMLNGNGRFPNVAAGNSMEISNFRRALPQFLAVSVKNILLFVYGMTLGFPTILIPSIQGGDGREPSDIVLNRDQISWLSSINLICVPLGCLFSGLITQPLGKRRAMQFVNLPILASWLLFHFSTKTEHLYAALCLSGLGGGLMEAPVLTYVAEITEPKYRGILSALGSTSVIAGVFIQFIMGSFMDWRTIAAVSSAFPVISIITLCFVPESPTWLIRVQRFREAIKALQWLRGWVPEMHIEEEFNRLYYDLITRPALEEQEECSNALVASSWCNQRFKMFRKRSFLVPFILVAYTFFTGHFSGKTPLQTYAVQIFHTLKAPVNKYHATILLGVAEMVATIMCVCLIHFTGKRPLVLISTIGVAICFFGTATYAHYLKVVPGFAINNVVVNASSIVSRENIITQQNITTIFENEEKALQMIAADALKSDMDKQNMAIYPPSSSFGDMELTAMGTFGTTIDSLNNRTRREEINYLSTGNFSRNDNDTFLDLIELDYGETNGTLEYTTPALDLYDLDEIELTTSTPLVTEKIKVKPVEKSSSSDLIITVPKQQHNSLAWLPLVLLLGSAFFAHLGIRMIPWILIGEVFPASVRSTASGLVSAVGYIFGFLANKLFLQMLSTLSLPGTFWFYSAVALVGAVVLFFKLPETEGRSLAEIEAHFSKKSEFNLLKSKTVKKPDTEKASMQLDNLQVPIGPYTEAKIIQLQQSDLLPDRRSQGVNNLAFQENNTTHL